ncbi:uncharacterized protein LOC143414201 [Maylandia zebra]|uniref:uncharacterized protein LOC143414201 n=1 Tax=Maylandia zebra TaxID=106582 RepID=UPI00403C88D1
MGLAAEDHTGCPSCQLKTGNEDYTSQKLTKFGQQKTGKVLPLYRSSDGCFQQDNMPVSIHFWDVVEGEISIMDVQLTNLQQLMLSSQYGPKSRAPACWEKPSRATVSKFGRSQPDIRVILPDLPFSHISMFKSKNPSSSDLQGSDD